MSINADLPDFIWNENNIYNYSARDGTQTMQNFSHATPSGSTAKNSTTYFSAMGQQSTGNVASTGTQSHAQPFPGQPGATMYGSSPVGQSQAGQITTGKFFYQNQCSYSVTTKRSFVLKIEITCFDTHFI